MFKLKAYVQVKGLPNFQVEGLTEGLADLEGRLAETQEEVSITQQQGSGSGRIC